MRGWHHDDLSEARRGDPLRRPHHLRHDLEQRAFLSQDTPSSPSSILLVDGAHLSVAAFASYVPYISVISH